MRNRCEYFKIFFKGLEQLLGRKKEEKKDATSWSMYQGDTPGPTKNVEKLLLFQQTFSPYFC